MKEFGPETFGALNAEDYDAVHDPGTTGVAVALVAELAGKGKVLEVAIGTGRVAVPLAKRGVAIEGIDASTEMVAKLREKPGGEKIPVVIGDMAVLPVGGPYDFAFLIFNTLFNLTTQEEQVRCFERVAAKLNDGGGFLVEAFVPDISRFEGNQIVRTRRVTFDTVTLEAGLHDPVRQVIDHQYIRLGPDGTKLIPLPMRYVWPSEMDLMARLAGLELEDRWGGWKREPFTADSKMHVSLYRKT